MNEGETWYRWSRYDWMDSKKIEELQVDRMTEKSVWWTALKDVGWGKDRRTEPHQNRELLDSHDHKWFPTWAEAITFLILRRETQVKDRKEQWVRAQDKLMKARELTIEDSRCS